MKRSTVEMGDSSLTCLPTNPKGRIGILTGGGDCPGLNAVIRAVCTTANNLYNYETIGFHDGFEGLYTGGYTNLTCKDVSDLIAIGGTVLGTTNRGHFGCPLEQAVIDKAHMTYKELNLKCIVAIGGDGTMAICHRLSESCKMNFVGVPKTIDNDLSSTDQTFGFDSAVSVCTEAIDRLHTTAAAHHRVMIVEAMGRNAGWIALHAGVAGGACVILLPEVEWAWDPIIRKIKDVVANHPAHYAVVVVSEGIKLPESGQVTLADSKEVEQKLGARPEARLGGVGYYVAEKISKLTGYETRTTVLGHIQRGGSPSCFDRILATKYGSMAAKMACEGDYGKLASLKGTKIVSTPITGQVAKQKLVDVATDQVVWAARSTGVIFGDEKN